MIRPPDLKHDLVLPTILFAGLGAMSWAVRGSSGYGGSAGCIFAGVLWGAAWWFIVREPGAAQSRRYTSGWIILAMTVGFGIAGSRGWAQWWTLYDGRLQTDYAKGEFVPISPVYGYAWVFISGIPWAGIGACMLAWCGDAWRPANARDWALWIGKWVLRIGFGYAGMRLAQHLFVAHPNVFLPLYDQIEDRYKDFQANPNLRRMMNDNRSAIAHLGLYLGFLAFEAVRRDWKNVTLIATVGLINGVGWSLFQNWALADKLFPNTGFNWWRCWESSGGISIGIAYGVAYYVVNRPLTDKECTKLGDQLTDRWPNLERFGAYLGLLLGLGFSIRNGLKGWANIYLGDEEYWSNVLRRIIGPIMIAAFILLLVHTIRAARLRGMPKPVFPRAYTITWGVLIVMNILAQLVTSSPRHWTETVFAVYYLVLFGITALIIRHYSAPRRDNIADTHS